MLDLPPSTLPTASEPTCEDHQGALHRFDDQSREAAFRAERELTINRNPQESGSKKSTAGQHPGGSAAADR
jgi:hypothetical protein